MIPDNNRLIRAFKKNRVVLVLGPDAIPYTNSKGEISTFSKISRSMICDEISEKDYQFFEHERLFHFKTSLGKQQAQEIVQDLSSEGDWQLDEILLKKIISIPFPLVFNLNPDKQIYRSFGKYWKYPQFGYLSSTGHQSVDFKEVDPFRNPILYQLAGSTEDDEKSIVLDYHDMFGSLKAVLSNGIESSQIIKQLQKTTHYILLGVDLDRWYFQLLLHYINHLGPANSFENNNKNIVLYCNISNNTEHFLKEHFLVEKTNLEKEDFESLFDELKALDETGTSRVRKLREPTANYKELVRGFLEENNFEKAFDVLKSYLEDDHLLNEISNQRGQYNRIIRDYDIGNIGDQVKNKKMHHLRIALLDFLTAQ